jgi:hypothetical protein
MVIGVNIRNITVMTNHKNSTNQFKNCPTNVMSVNYLTAVKIQK